MIVARGAHSVSPWGVDMGAKATIFDASKDGPVLGHISAAAVSFEEGRGTVIGSAATKLKEMLGRGYGRRRFHILLPASRLEHCQIVSPHVVFIYEAMRHLDVDEAPPTFPEHIIDEDTPTDEDMFR